MKMWPTRKAGIAASAFRSHREVKKKTFLNSLALSDQNSFGELPLIISLFFLLITAPPDATWLFVLSPHGPVAVYRRI
jgi:hypothetical protein